MKPRLKFVLSSGLVLFGVWIAIALAQDSMTDFGIKVDEMESRIVDALVKGNIPVHPDKKMFKSAPSSAQTALVRNTLNWLKVYTQSESFKKDYLRQRDAAKPAAPKPASVDEKYAAYLAERREGLEKMKQEVAQMPPDVRKQMQDVLKQMEDEFENSAKDQNMITQLKEGYAQESVYEQQTYQEQLTAWEKQYPQDPNQLVVNRLRQFMDTSGNIAFDAQLVPDAQGQVMKFADPKYEAQTKAWKLCYRAGREPVQAARAFVGEWLKQIENK